MLLSDVAEPYNRLMVHGFVDFLPNLDQWKSRQPPRVFHTHLPYNSLPDTVKEKSKVCKSPTVKATRDVFDD